MCPASIVKMDFPISLGDLATWFQALVSVATIIVGVWSIKWQLSRQYRSELENSLETAKSISASLAQAIREIAISIKDNDHATLCNWVSTLTILVKYASSVSIVNLDSKKSWEYLQILSKASQCEQKARNMMLNRSLIISGEIFFFENAFDEIDTKVKLFDIQSKT